MIILKEEINAAGRDLLSLAKWRVGIVAALAVVGLGLNKDLSDPTHGYLILFFVPYVSLYIDMWRYQRVTNLLSIARYLREYSGSDSEQLQLKAYELAVEKTRSDPSANREFEHYAEFAASLALSMGLPLFGLLKFPCGTWKFLWIPAIGWILIGYFFHRHLMELKKFHDGKAEAKLQQAVPECELEQSDHQDR